MSSRRAPTLTSTGKPIEGASESLYEDYQGLYFNYCMGMNFEQVWEARSLWREVCIQFSELPTRWARVITTIGRKSAQINANLKSHGSQVSRCVPCTLSPLVSFPAKTSAFQRRPSPRSRNIPGHDVKGPRMLISGHPDFPGRV